MFTRDSTAGAQSGKIYINGEDQTDLNPENLESEDFSTDLSGDFSEWSDNYSLLLGNEKTKNRPWDGEIHQVAIYSRALSREEIYHSYFPAIKLEATLTLSNVPAPLDAPLPVTIDLDADQLTVVQASLAVAPFLHFNRVTFTWEQSTPTIRFISGQVAAALWGNELDFDVSFTAEELTLSQPDASQKTLVLNEVDSLPPLGDIHLTALSLRADRTVNSPDWTFDTDGQATFSIIPPPLKGPFPAQLFLDQGQLWFSVSPTVPLKLVEELSFDRANLRFVRDESGWRVQPDLRDDRGGIRSPLFGEPLPLTTQLVATDTTKALTLDWSIDPASDQLGKLNLSHFRLEGNPIPGEVFWSIGMAGKVKLGLLGQNSQADIVDFGGLDFSTEEGEILGDPNNAQQPLRLRGKSVLENQTFPIFSGDLQLQGDRVFLNGSLNLFPSWSILQVKGEPQFEIGPNGQVSFAEIPAQVILPDSVLLDPTLVLENGRLALSGLWVWQAQAQVFYIRDRGGDIFLDGATQLSLPFSLNLPALFDPKTGGQLASATQISGGQMNISLDVEFQKAGFLAVLNADFNYADANQITQTITLPERRLYSPPANLNALLGDILAQVRETASELFQQQGRHTSDYFVILGSDQPHIFLSSAGSAETEISTDMPALFTADAEISSDNSIFSLNQTGEICQLTLNLAGNDQAAIRAGYDDLLTKVAARGLLSAGAANVLKRRIAERLPLDYSNLLYYYYGWDVEKGYLDLQAGMRLRIDLQNYQFVQASDRTAQRGFVGSGSFYVPVNSYTYPQSDGGYSQLLGFGPFLSRLQVNGDVDIANNGAGSVFDLLKDGYRKAYYRLFFPKQPSTGSGSERVVTLIGADTLQEMADATDAFDASGDTPTVGTSFFFRGKAAILPEIQVYVGNKPTYAPVGATIRQLVEMHDDIPSAGLPGQDLRTFSGAARPLRLVHEGVNSEASYRFINLEASDAIGNMDILDLPLVKGDRFCF